MCRVPRAITATAALVLLGIALAFDGLLWWSLTGIAAGAALALMDHGSERRF